RSPRRTARCSAIGRSNTAGGWSGASRACVNSKARRCHSGECETLVGCVEAARRLRARRHLIEEAGDVLDATAVQHGEVGALDRTVGAIGAETPREADVVAVAVGLADQGEAEIRKALLHAGYQRVDALMAVAGHQRIDIAGIGGPVAGEQVA